MSSARPSRLGALLLVAWLALCPSSAWTHAVIVLSSPAVDAVVQGRELAAALRFNSRIDHARSRLTLIGPGGAATVLPLKGADRPDTLAAALVGLKPGSYRLRWQVLAVDGHITRGDIPFTVAP